MAAFEGLKMELEVCVCVCGFSGPYCVDTQKLRNQQEMHETAMDD